MRRHSDRTQDVSESLAGWENEGGAGRSTPHTRRRLPSDPMVEFPPTGDPDTGIVDKHTLGMMQVSLLLLIPVLGAIAIFWGYVAGGRPGEGL